MNEPYGIYSEFDIEKHKAAFTNYLEVVIDADGTVMYAVPSHQEMLINIACERLGVTRDELKTMCPAKYYADFMRWLCLLTGAMAVWNDCCEYGNPTVKQLGTLRNLKMSGLYKGMLPNDSRDDPKCSTENLLRAPEDPEESHERIEESLRLALSLLRPQGGEE